MTRSQQLYNLIAAMGWITVAEILCATRWRRKQVSGCLVKLIEADAVKVQNINGKRYYVPS